MIKTEFDVFCPKCNVLVEAKVIASGHGGFRSNAVTPVDVVDSEYYGDHYSICICRRCSEPFLIRESQYGIPGEYETVVATDILYPTESKPLGELPTTIKSSYDQAVRSFSASLFEPCVLMCRKCIEATCRSLGASGRDLNSKLNSLFESGHIDSRLLNWAHEIRLVGNETAHETESTLEKQDARDILDFTEAILISIFSLTARFNAFKARRTK